MARKYHFFNWYKSFDLFSAVLDVSFNSTGYGISVKAISVSSYSYRFEPNKEWLRKTQGLGLTTAYNDRTSEDGNFLKYLFGLPFLEKNFADYILENSVSPDATFPPPIWTQ